MRRLFLIFIIMSISYSTVNANSNTDSIERKTLNITSAMEKEVVDNPKSPPKPLLITFPEGTLNTSLLFTKNLPDSVFLVLEVDKSKSEKDYFTALTYTYKWFLRNWKIGKSHKKTLITLFAADVETYPYLFEMNISDLKLLNNRDFGEKDLTSFDDGGMVYPIKEILKMGKFINRESHEPDDNITERYHAFLSDYDISPLTEPAIEAFFYNKTNGVTKSPSQGATASSSGSIPYVQVKFSATCGFVKKCIEKNLSISGESGDYKSGFDGSSSGAIHRGYNGLAGTYNWSASLGDDRNTSCSGSFHLSGNKKNYDIRVYDDCRDAGSQEY